MKCPCFKRALFFCFTFVLFCSCEFNSPVQPKRVQTYDDGVRTVDVSIIDDVGGRFEIHPEQDVFKRGDAISVKVIPDSGWVCSDLSGIDNEAVELPSFIEESEFVIPITITDDLFIEITFERISCTLSVGNLENCSLMLDGETVSSGYFSFFENDRITLSVTPESGFFFSHWDSGTDEVWTKPDLEIVMTSNLTLTPVMARQLYTVSHSVSGNGNLLFNPSPNEFGQLAEGTQLTITAQPQDGWGFSSWSGKPDHIEPVLTLDLEADVNIEAVFLQIFHNIDLTVIGEGTVIRSVSESNVSQGSEILFSAQPAEGWSFVEWQGALSGTANPQSLSVTDDILLTAVFERNEYPLTVASVDGGSASFTQNWQLVTSAFENDTATLTAMVDPGWSFSHWEGSVTGNINPLTVTVKGPMDVTPVFSRNMFSIETYTTGTGRAEAAIGNDQVTTIAQNTEVTFSAVPGTGWVFSHWEGDLAGSVTPRTLMITADTQVTAVFLQQVYDLVLSAGEGGSAACNIVPTDIAHGTFVTVEATADTDWEFLRWEGDHIGTDPSAEILMDGPKNIKAVFGRIQYSIQSSFNTAGSSIILTDSGENLGNQSFLNNSSIGLTAVAPNGSTGYLFSHWLVDGLKYSVEPDIRIVMNQDHTVEPVFVKRDWLFLVYMNGDCDLEANAIQDLNEMETIDLNQEGVEILVLLDRTDGYDGSNGDWTETRLLRVVYDENSNDLVIRSYEVNAPPLGLERGKRNELNMGDPLILSSLIDFAQTHYKADYYGLFIWGHGNGWRNARSADLSSGLESAPLSSYRSFTADASNSFDALYTAELGSAVAGHTQNLDTIIFDTCSGGMLEVAYEFRDSVSYMAASEDLIPADGMEYNFLFANISDRIRRGGILTDGGLGGLAVDSFAQAYDGQAGANFSTVQLNQMETVNLRLNAFSNTVSAYCGTQERADQVRSLLFGQNGETVESFFQAGSDMNLDLSDMARAVQAEGIAIPEAQNLMDALNNAVIHSWTHGLGNPRASGLAIHYVPLNSLLNAEAHDGAYLQNSNVSNKPAFIADSTWVPNLITQTGLLYTLWYKTY